VADDIQEALNKLKAQRAEASTVDQTEAEAVDVSEDTPDEEVEEITAEAEESEELSGEVEDVQESESEDDPDTLVYEIKGKQYTQEQLIEALEGGLRLSDYTRKTQLVAEDRKSVAAKGEKQDQLLDDLQSHIDLLAEMTDSEFDGINWDELREDNTSEYLRLKEKKESKRGKLDKAKSDRQKLLDDKRSELAGAEQSKLFAAMGWQDAPSKQEADLKLMQTYLQGRGWTNEDFVDVINHKHMMAIMDAAKFHQLQSKASATTKKVKQAPKVVKGRTASVTSIQRQVNEAKAKLKKTGKVEDAMTLRKLQRQLK